MALTPGSRLGPYEILAPLGAGGMGEVYRARDTKLDRDVAVKVLPSSLARDPAALARFEREAKAVAALSHPNILAVHDFGTSEGTSYAVMELLEGESLRERLAEGALPPRKASEIAREIALGLAAAHDKGIVHRDLKPENLFLTNDGRVKILDFGLARQLALPSSGDTHSPTAAPGTEPGTVLGTVGYMAPEQIRGLPADPRTDIFSFGAVLYEMLAGRRAFLGETAVETMNAILKEDPPELAQSGRQIPPGLERIVSHCLEKKPDERFQSARDLAFDLGSLSTATVASGAVGAIPTTSRWLRRLALAVAGLAVVALALWMGTRLVSGGAVAALRMKRLTFRRGNILTARFAPDGQTVVYGAAWEGKPSELFSARTDSVESRPLGLDHANVLSVSSTGELAVQLRKGTFQTPGSPGTLARVPLGGGAARELQDNVYSAAWAPDAENLAVMSLAPSGKSRLEYPVGRLVEESFYLYNNAVRVSPGGELAFAEGDFNGLYTIRVSDRQGRKKALVQGLKEFQGFAWSRRTGELFFVGGRQTGETDLRAVSTAGRERLVWTGANGFYLHDVAPDGRLLLERFIGRQGIIWRSADGAPERDLGWLDGTNLRALSRDGSRILFAEAGEGAGPIGGVYLRRTDGSPAMRLGDGEPWSLSPDGKWALAITVSATPEIMLLPTGTGSPRKVAVEGIKPFGAIFIGDGSKIAIFHSAPGEPPRLSVVGLDGGRPTAIAVPGISARNGIAFSLDGARIAYGDTEHRIRTAPISGGAPATVPGAALGECEYVADWSGDGRFIVVENDCDVPERVLRVSVQSGERTPWKELQPNDGAGVILVSRAFFTSDGTGYAYKYFRNVSSDLFLVDGLK
jgi:hypothetical protein